MKSWISWHLFQRRLRRYVQEMHDLDDPWSSEENLPAIREIFTTWPLHFEGIVCELGSGQGHVASIIPQKYNQLILVEISKNAIERSRKRLVDLPNVEHTQKDVHEFFPTSKKINLVIMSFILDYLGFREYPKRFIDLAFLVSDSLAEHGQLLIIHPLDRDEERLKQFIKIFMNAGLELIQAAQSRNQPQALAIILLQKKN